MSHRGESSKEKKCLTKKVLNEFIFNSKCQDDEGIHPVTASLFHHLFQGSLTDCDSGSSTT